MKPGDVVLTPLPQEDGQVKPRPAVVLAMLPPFNDAIACGISTQLRHAVPGFDEFMQPQDDDFPSPADLDRILRRWHPWPARSTAMTITLPAEQDSFLSQLVALGRFASAEEAVAEAVRRLETEEALGYLIPEPLTAEEAAQVYAADVEWEKVERAMAGRAKFERVLAKVPDVEPESHDRLSEP